MLHPMIMTSAEMKRWLTSLGAKFKPGKGGHFKVFLNGRRSILAMHSKDLGKGTEADIKKQLGLK